VTGEGEVVEAAEQARARLLRDGARP
jgi:hypothetical protein